MKNKHILIASILFLMFCGAPDAMSQWTPTNGPYGGPVICFAVNGTNLFASARKPYYFTDTYKPAGIFVSIDSGTTWKEINNGLPMNMYCSALAVSGTKLIAGTDGGVYVSADSGTSWSPSFSGFNFHYVLTLATIGANLFAGTDSGVVLSTNNGTSWKALDNVLKTHAVNSFQASGTNLFAGTDSGVYVSTDNGASWAQVSAGMTSMYVITLAGSGTNLFAATFGGLFRSTNNGISWDTVNTGLVVKNVISLAISGINLLAGTDGGGVLLSTDNGANWAVINSGLTSPIVNVLAVNGTILFAGTDGGGVFRTVNNGTNWIEANTGLTGNYSTALAVMGTDLFIGSYYGIGVFRSSNNGTTWTATNTGIEKSEVSALLVSGSDLFAGARIGSGVFHSTDNGASWDTVSSGSVTNVTTLAGNGNNLFAGTWNSGILHSTNKGASWTLVNTGLTNTNVRALLVNGTNLFAGTQAGVFRSTNNGTGWANVSTGLLGNGVVTLAVSGTNLFAGTPSGGIFRSTNNGISWTAVNTGLTASNVYTLLVSDTNLFAGTDEGVFRSTDNGKNWSAANTSLVNAVTTLAVNGTNLYAGTALGKVWRHLLYDFVSDTAAKILVSGSPVKFGKIKVDSSASRTIKIRNSSIYEFTLMGTVTGIKAPFTLQGAPVSFNIARGDSLVVTVGFAPTKTGNYYDTLLVTSNTDSARHIIKVYLSGTGMPDDTIAHPVVSVPALDFGNRLINSSVTDTLNITNTGDPFIQWSARISSLKPAPSPFSITSGGGNPLLLVGAASRRVTIKFLPKTAGTFYDTLRITTTDTTNVEAAQRLIVIPITGVGVDQSSVSDETIGPMKIWLFPNPMGDMCHLKLSLSVLSEVTITIFNELGIEVRKMDAGKIPMGDRIIDLSMDNLAAGNYFCRVRIGTQEKFLRIIVSDSRK
jgi:ligand-binding sensor domain-containing protein